MARAEPAGDQAPSKHGGIRRHQAKERKESSLPSAAAKRPVERLVLTITDQNEVDFCLLLIQTNAV